MVDKEENIVEKKENNENRIENKIENEEKLVNENLINVKEDKEEKKYR